MGRPTKLTPEAQAKIVQAIQAGNHKESAAAYAGVPAATLSEWLAKGRAGKSPYAELWKAVHEAEAQAEVRIVAQWQKQIPDNWQAAKDFLARRYPERWAETHKIVGLVEKELEKALDKLANTLPAEQYAAVLAILAGEDSPPPTGNDAA